jgi:hypothetical protein
VSTQPLVTVTLFTVGGRLVCPDDEHDVQSSGETDLHMAWPPTQSDSYQKLC